MSSHIPLIAGDIDRSFGFRGFVEGPENAVTHSVFSTANGMLIYAIHNDSHFEIYRVHPDGSPDTSFGEGGVFRWQFQEGRNSIPRRLILSGNNILVIGDITFAAEGIPAVTLLNENGTPNLAFGRVSLPLPAFSNNSSPSDGCIQLDRKILILSQRTEDAGISWRNGQLTRLTTAGAIDKDFGEQGHIKISYGEGYSNMHSVAVQPNGKIVVGASYSLDIERIVLSRYETTGSLDTSFGTDGYVYFGSQPGRYWLEQMIVQPDGKLVCAGFSNGKALIMRFDIDGAPDLTFNNGSEVLIDLGHANGSWSTVTVQPDDGKIVAAGWTPGFPSQMAWGRLNADGSLDSGFGNNGWIKGLLAGIPYDLTLQANRIIIVGSRNNSGNAVLCGVQR